ncbi:MAG: glycosyltransferase [Acidimicrobiales bacterium]
MSNPSIGLERSRSAPESQAIAASTTQATAADLPRVSIVIPTRNERANIGRLLEGLDHAFRHVDAEVLFVDDSDDGTADEVRERTASTLLPVRVVHRRLGERAGGLGTAVKLGFSRARAPWALVMDGDLQHPPEAAAAVATCALTEQVDLVIGSRYEPGGAADGLSKTRLVASRGAHLLAKAMFPVRLGAISDPLSGLFAVRLASVDTDLLEPDGFKVLMEILLQTPRIRPAEVAFRFEGRRAGESKADRKEALAYLALLARRRLEPAPARVVRYQPAPTVAVA